MHWKRDPRNNRLYIYHYRDGRTRILPKKLYSHLEAQPDCNIQAWIADYEDKYVKRKVTPDHMIGGRLEQQLKEFIHWQKDVMGKDPKTYKQHHSLLTRYGLPYFLSKDPPLRDPYQWPGAGTGMLAYLLEKGVTENNIRRVNMSVRRFYAYLQDTGGADRNQSLALWSPKEKETRKDETRLEITPSPEDILTLADSLNPKLSLIALIGYFFSLRPQELFDLRPSDFRAGVPVDMLECCKAMAKHDLFNLLAANIRWQRGVVGEKPAKTRGWVACFNQDAAVRIVEALNDYEEDERLLTGSMRYLYRQWEDAKTGLTLKDLRRASLYYLGHHTGFSNSAIELMKHARHEHLTTTMKYLRRPGEEVRGKKLSLGIIPIKKIPEHTDT